VAEQVRPFSVRSDGVTLSGERAGAGPAVVLLHGLTATRRYVLMGSRLLERSGYEVVAYDARGHGHSAPAAEPSAYTYEHLARDLLAVLDGLGVQRAILAGASMGAHTALRVALTAPERVMALGLITPAYEPAAAAATQELSGWQALAEGLRREGVEGFVRAYDFSAVPERWRETVERVMRQRLSAHEHPQAVADALEVVPRSRPFATMAELAAVEVPAVVVGSRNDADPGHPLALAEEYAAALPGAQLVVEAQDSSPIAWQGGRLSRVLAELARRAGAAAAGHT
jgi:pimeloyl-ACP methyl ester carboxylesterase